MTAEGWEKLARHPDGRPRLVFDDLAARYPERYGEPDMPPKPPPPQAPKPGAVPADEIQPVDPGQAPLFPGLPSTIGVDTAPGQFGDGEAFQMTSDGNRYGYQDARPNSVLVDAPTPNAQPVDLATVVVDDPHSYSFGVLLVDVWEKSVPAGTTVPSFFLRFARGSRIQKADLAALIGRSWPPVTEVK